ncbi:conjugative transfer protein MobI(A/C) [Methylomonas sp. BW4-1]|uniref:conjugative transfer protein MobI(A/C) n=1 Tax=Methylomonas sp. BW4-1 TaxID=3376685 RepID=UPI00404109EA
MNPTSSLSEVDLLIWVEARSEQLYAQARMLVDDYWRQLKSRHEKYGKTESGRIGVRIRRRESSFSFSIEWYRMATLRQNGQNKPIAQYLKKGLGYRYPLQRILKGEPDWEVKLVEELETEFVDIRKQVDCLGKIRDAVQNYRKATQTRIE